MTELTYTGFRYRWDRSDASAPNGVLSTHCLVIARAASEAERILAETVTGSPVGLQLIRSGTKELRVARTVGLREGEAKVL